MELPAEFVARLAVERGSDAADAVLATMVAEKHATYWVNPLRDGDLPAIGSPVADLPGVYAAADGRENLVRHPAAGSGRIYLVNPSSVLAVTALGLRPSDALLDLAAAPGGKTLLAAAQMGNGGSILAVDSVKARYFRMKANLDRCGVANARSLCADGRRLGHRHAAAFDRVLLDAPCSSEARFRADRPETFAYWSPRKVREMVRKQRGLIRAAFACLKPGGTLVYCTCAFGRRENEGAVEYLLKHEPTAEVVPVEWPALPTAIPAEVAGTVRIMPDAVFDGFYIARLTKRLGRRVVD